MLVRVPMGVRHGGRVLSIAHWGRGSAEHGKEVDEGWTVLPKGRRDRLWVARRKTEAGTTALSDKNAPITEGDPQITGSNVETNLADIHGSPSQVTQDDQIPRHLLLDNSQSPLTEMNDDVALDTERSISTREKRLPEPGLTKVEGYFPCGTNLKVSTPGGATVIIKIKRAAVVSTVAV